MADSVLPASRLDAIFVVVPAALSALAGAAPKSKCMAATLTTVVANVYAIGTSVVTFKDVYADAPELYEDAAMVLYILVSTTILTSVCILIGIFAKIRVKHWVVYASVVISCIALIDGLYYLYQLYLAACIVDGGTSELCDHDRETLVLVFNVGGILALIYCVVLAIVLRSVEKRGEHVRQGAETPIPFRGGDIESQTPAVALMSRVSAVCKAAIVGAFWFLVDDAMVWGGFSKQDAFWWATGQLLKHSAALLNNGLNQC